MSVGPGKSIKTALVTFTMAASLLGLACGLATPTTPAQATPTAAPTPVQTQRVALTYAKGFKVEHLGDGYKKVSDGEERQLLLVPRGKQVPDRYKDLKQVQIPVQSVVVLSSTQVSLLRPLGVLGTIIGTSQDRNWYIDEMKAGLASGKIAFVGANTAPDYEKLISLKADVVFLNTRSGRMNEVLTKLDELRIPAAVDNEFLENHPLGRLEWIKFLAAFFDKEEEARVYFEQTQKRVDDILAKTKNVAGTRMFWALLRDGNIYVAKGGQYETAAIELAGGDSVFKDLPGTTAEGRAPITAEELVARAKNADVWINREFRAVQPTIKDVVVANPFIKDFKALTEGNAWKLQPWWFDTLDKADEQIQDLAAIFHPELFPGHQLKHLTKMPKE